MNLTIPPINRNEWNDLLTGTINHKFQNFVLQMKITQLNKDIVAQKSNIETAKIELYNLCLKYTLAVQSDCVSIFKSW